MMECGLGSLKSKKEVSLKVLSRGTGIGGGSEDGI